MKFLTQKTAIRFDALQKVLVPRAVNFTPEEQLRSRKMIDDLLLEKPAAILFKIKLFLVLIDVISFFFGGKCFRYLNLQKQKQVLHWFFDSKIALLRKGFWGVNTLAKMGVYGQKEFYKDMGYVLREVSR